MKWVITAVRTGASAVRAGEPTLVLAAAAILSVDPAAKGVETTPMTAAPGPGRLPPTGESAITPGRYADPPGSELTVETRPDPRAVLIVVWDPSADSDSVAAPERVGVATPVRAPLRSPATLSGSIGPAGAVIASAREVGDAAGVEEAARVACAEAARCRRWVDPTRAGEGADSVEDEAAVAFGSTESATAFAGAAAVHAPTPIARAAAPTRPCFLGIAPPVVERCQI